MTCSACGSEVSPNDRFCSRCGSSLSVADEERRVISVLFADIVGFTTLAERLDPEEVKRLVDRWFKRLTEDINSFGGVVDKVLGDAIVALFGAPVAHEDDAERAVRAALKMQSSLQELAVEFGAIEMRIGINTGQVLVGTSTGGDYTAMGDVMNSAARLQGLAEPGQILVGANTHSATKDAIRYDAAGMLKAKGREDLLETWIATETTRTPGTHRQREGAFVGRDNEVQLLMAQSRLAVERSQAQMALILGEAGLGKTRLVQHTANSLSEQYDALLIRGRCVPYGVANVWWPLADITRQIFGFEIDQSQTHVEKELNNQLSARFGTDHPNYDRFFTSILHALGYDTALRGGYRNRNRSEVLFATASLFSSLLEERPLVVVLADMHWAADAIWLLLDHLMEQLSGKRLMVLLTAREVESDVLHSVHRRLSVTHLGPLDEESSRRLLSDFAPDLPPAMAKDLVHRAGGNPFFLEELAGLVRSQGMDEKSFAVGSGTDRLAELPDSLRGIVAARVDNLNARERAVLEGAAVIGSSGRIRHLQIMSDQSHGDGDITPTLELLEQKGLLSLDGSRYSFKSDVVRDVAYGTITKAVRAKRHYDFAEHLASTQTGGIRNSVVVAIADHYRAAAELSSELSSVGSTDRLDAKEKALFWLRQAGDRALAVDQPVQAAKWFSYGVAMATDPVTAVDFLYGRASARCEVHDIRGSKADLDRLDELVVDPKMKAKVLMIRGDTDRKAGDLDLASSRLREAADRLGVLGSYNDQAKALRLLGLAEMRRLDGSLAHQALEASRRVAADAGDKGGEAWALQSLAWLAFRYGRTIEAKGLVDDAMRVFEELGDRGGLTRTKSIDAWVAFHQGRAGDAQLLVDEVLPETRRRGDPWSEGLTLNLAASLKLWSGQAADAYELARQSQEVAKDSDAPNVIAQARALEGRSLVSLGRVAEGVEVLEAAYVHADRVDSKESRRLAAASNCASAARLGEPERALLWANRYTGISKAPAVVGEVDLTVSWALALLQRGELGEAIKKLEWVGLEQSQTADYYGLATAAVLEAAQGHVSHAERYIDQVLIGRATYLDRVLAMLAWAATKYQIGDTEGCRDAIRAARDEVSGTDDSTTPLMIDLVAGVCGLRDLKTAEQQMLNSGLEPTGWRTAWELATSHRKAPTG